MSTFDRRQKVDRILDRMGAENNNLVEIGIRVDAMLTRVATMTPPQRAAVISQGVTLADFDALRTALAAVVLVIDTELTKIESTL